MRNKHIALDMTTKNILCPLFNKVHLNLLKVELEALKTEYNEMIKPEVKEDAKDMTFDPVNPTKTSATAPLRPERRV